MIRYHNIISVHDVTNKISSYDSSFIVAVVMWPKFGNFGISVREEKPIDLNSGFGRSSVIWE